MASAKSIRRCWSPVSRDKDTVCRLREELRCLRQGEADRLAAAINEQRDRDHREKVAELGRQKEVLGAAHAAQLFATLASLRRIFAENETTSPQRLLDDFLASLDENGNPTIMPKDRSEDGQTQDTMDGQYLSLPTFVEEHASLHTTPCTIPSPSTVQPTHPAFGINLGENNKGFEANILRKSLEEADLQSSDGLRHKGIYGKMADLLTHLRHLEDDKLKLTKRLMEMERLQVLVKEKNKEYFTRNLELSSTNRKLSSKIKLLSASVPKQKEDKLYQPSLCRAQSQELLSTTSTEEAKPKIDNKMYHLDSSISRLGRDHDPSSSHMSPIEEEDEESDWIEEKRKIVSQNATLCEKVKLLQEQQRRIEAELQESRDQNELLEFRIFELEECQACSDLSSKGGRERCDQCVNTDPWLWMDEPTDAGDALREFREEKLEEVKLKLRYIVNQQLGLMRLCPESKAAVLQAMALLDVCNERIKELQENMNPLCSLQDKLMATTKLDSDGKVVCRGRDDAKPREADAVSQGGETGYSSDDSDDPPTSLSVSSSGSESFDSGCLRNDYEDVLRKIGSLTLAEDEDDERMRLTPTEAKTSTVGCDTGDLVMSLDAGVQTTAVEDTDDGICDTLREPNAAIDVLTNYNETKSIPSDCETLGENELRVALSMNDPKDNVTELSRDSDNSETDFKRLLTEIEAKLTSKETEYFLKLEALKCDHEETAARLECRLEALRRQETESREQIEALNQRLKEYDVERNTMLQQIEELQTEKAQLEQELVNTNAELNRFRHLEEVYEDGCSSDDSRSPQQQRRKKDSHRRLKMGDLQSLLEETAKSGGDNSSGLLLPSPDANGDSRDRADLVRSESRLRQRVFELEKKEIAYRETLREADKIMAEVERGYRERIDELEGGEQHLRTRIVQLEQSEKRLRQALRSNTAARSNEVGKIGELLDRLLETEASERRLKDRIRDLERNEAEVRERLSVVEQEKQRAESELKEQEELVRTVHQLRQSEAEKKGRIDELETSESALRETLAQADAILAQRENSLNEKLSLLEEELASERKDNCRLRRVENTLLTLLPEAHNTLHGFQAKVCDGKEQCEVIDTTLDINKEQMENTLTALQSEIAKLQQCVATAKLQLLDLSEPSPSSLPTNSPPPMSGSEAKAQQMTDLLETNGRLQLQVAELEDINDKLRSRVLDAECRLATIQQRNLSLHTDEIKRLKDKINSISLFIKNCDCTNCANCEPLLLDIEGQVHLLDEIICGSSGCVDMREDKEKAVSSPGDHLETISRDKAFVMLESQECLLQKNLSEEQNNNLLATTSNGANDKIFNSLNNNKVVTEDTVKDLQNRLAQLESQLSNNQQHLSSKESEINTLHTRIDEKEQELRTKVAELIKANSDIGVLRKDNEEYKQRVWKAEIAERVAQEKLSKKTQELDHVNKQMRELEQKLLNLNRQLRNLEQSQKDATNSRERIHELESELLKRKENERKLYAENLHLHHKVEAQKERINSLQQIKKEYKLIVTKCDALEKKKNIAEQNVAPLRSKVTQLTQKCKDREQTISRLNKQLIHKTNGRSVTPKMHSTKYIDDESGPEESDHHNHSGSQSEASEDGTVTDLRALTNSILNDRPFSPVSSGMSSSVSSDTFDNCDPHSDSALHRSSQRLTPRSRIPRYTALSTSPCVSPQFRPEFPSNKIINMKEISLQETPKHRRAMTPNGDVNLSREKIFKHHQKVKEEHSKFLSKPRTSIIPKTSSSDIEIYPRKIEKETLSIPESPSNFRITRKVGQDGLLVAWAIPKSDDSNKHTSVSGYQIYVNGVLHQKVRSPNRTKALLNSLDLSHSLDISIQTLSISGITSSPVHTRYSSSMDIMNNSHSESEESYSPLTRSIVKEGQLKLMKRKCIVLYDYNPHIDSPNHADPAFELEIHAGEVVTIFGELQPNGFYYGEVKGRRGLIPARAVKELQFNRTKIMDTTDIMEIHPEDLGNYSSHKFTTTYTKSYPVFHL